MVPIVSVADSKLEPSIALVDVSICQPEHVFFFGGNARLLCLKVCKQVFPLDCFLVEDRVSA